MTNNNTEQVIAARNLEIYRRNLPLFAQHCLKIRDTSGNLQPLVFNETQLKFHAFCEDQLKRTGMVRAVVSKGRKQGISTYTAARFFWKLLFNGNKQTYILSHHSQTTGTLFKIVDVFYQNLPDVMKPKLTVDNTRQLGFDNNSQYTVGTAGAGSVGRGDTIQFFHGSEVAFYENTDDLDTGILQAIAEVDGTEVILESTSNGVGNFFHQKAISAMEGKGRYELFFAPWFIHIENNAHPPDGFAPTPDESKYAVLYNLTPSQIYWRRLKAEDFKSDWKLMQEYPSTVQESFQTSGSSFISAEAIARARKSKLKDTAMPLIIGVDPAGNGSKSDRTILAFRRGRELFRVDKYMEMDPMRLAGILARIINEMHPAQIFIDNALGYGTMDRLREMRYGKYVTGVHFNEGAEDPDVFGNKRSEMAFTFRDWLSDGEVSIPDDDDIATDCLAIPEPRENSAGRLYLEPKEKIKKTYKKSTDIFDAIILTWAHPVRGDWQKGLKNNADMGYDGNTRRQSKDPRSPVLESFDTESRTKKSKKNTMATRWDQILPATHNQGPIKRWPV